MVLRPSASQKYPNLKDWSLRSSVSAFSQPLATVETDFTDVVAIHADDWGIMREKTRSRARAESWQPDHGFRGSVIPDK
jgi:hypothetical protein